MGQNDASPTTNPTVTPTLQNRGVISIVLGDYHFGALLENGKLLTWGSPSGTGLGDPYEIEPGQPGGFRTLQDRERAHSIETVPAISNPTEVKFDHGLKHPRERFAFSVAASGWHTGAIVVDLEEVSHTLTESHVESNLWNRVSPRKWSRSRSTNQSESKGHCSLHPVKELRYLEQVLLSYFEEV